MRSAGEKIVLTFFAMSFLIAVKPWRVSKTASRFYAGVGAFQLIRRSAYEKMGTHRRLAMEVVDDMKLGKLAKEAGVRSGVARDNGAVTVRWHAGVANIIRGTTKNFFAAAGFQLWLACIQILSIFLAFLVPLRGVAVRARLGALVRGRRPRDSNCGASGINARVRSLAALRADATHRRADFHVDADPFDGRDPVARRNHLARHVLSARGIEARRSVSVRICAGHELSAAQPLEQAQASRRVLLPRLPQARRPVSWEQR